ncbi:MAG: DUF5057 domain-containing protein [Oscillospiraceae bacterium]|nr:DUF5057 domain-containing protein [Oscillospiraceae bacterium]
MKRSTVDPASLMYKALSSVVNLPNVMGENQLTVSGVSGSDEAAAAEKWIMKQKEDLTKYLNLSRPVLTVTGKPTEYGGNFSRLDDYDCEGYLNFEFKINNPTDATPVQTRYRCNLYIDQNGDGRHSADERIYDFQLKEVKADGTTVAIENGQLQGKQEDVEITYRLSRQLKKSQFSGLVAWKLEVVKVGDSTAHDSEKGYAYIEPDDPTPIKVLQITNSNASNTANLATPYEAEGTEWELDPPNNMTDFQKLYKEVYDAGMYDITVETISVDSLNDLPDPFGELNNYEMIVLGFGDMYGNLEANAAQAVAQYIETGKSVLFTHDTTSIWNREKSTSGGLWGWLESMTNFRGYWGYHFNKIIRDKVGLDRYGVTNSTFQSMGVDAGTKRPISPEEATAREDAGYTVAYVPGKVDEAAGETQGYSNLTVARYQMDPDGPGNNAIDRFLNNLPVLGPIFEALFGSSDPITRATGATQVNKGHITEYPYKLGENLAIGETHEQYYQLNMNAKDITVWYCLSGSNYDMFKNDTINTYYIYNRGNITYSGAGHSALSAAEKKLFVNTMIAAYRAGNSAPTVEFKTAAGDNASIHLVPVEYSEGDTTNGQSLSGQQNIYFELQDTNLTSDKAVTVALYYEDLAPAEGVEGDSELKGSEEGAVAPVVKTASLGTIYRVDTGAAVVNTANLSSGILYRTAIPGEILNYFADQNPENGLKLYLKAITTIKGVGTIPDIKYTGFDVLTMKKLGLLRLE